jgi:lysozyme
VISFEPEKMWAQLRLHEGERLKPYVDTVGKVTIGVGRNLTDRGIRPDEAELMLRNDILEACDELDALFPAWRSLTAARQRVLIDMMFNLGRARLSKFERFLAAIKSADWPGASAEMLNSKWAEQVGARAQTLARMMVEG